MNHLYWTDDSDIRFTVDGIDINDGRIRVGENQTGLLGPLIVFSGSAQPEGRQLIQCKAVSSLLERTSV